MAHSILIIEDDTSLRGILRDTLAEEGYDVSEAHTGEEGLALALSKHPDLILLDIILPAMDGLGVLNQIRNDPGWGKNAKVIMLTNLSDNPSVAACLELGAHSFLVKADWTIEDILKTVKTELEGPTAQSTDATPLATA